MNDIPMTAEEETRLELLKRFGTGAGKRMLTEPPPNPLRGSNITPTVTFQNQPEPEREQITSPQQEHEIGYKPLFGLTDLVDFHYFITPEIKLHPWQAQELRRMSGWPTGRKEGDRIHWYKDRPNIACYCCANGSGKDMNLIGRAAVGLPLLYEGMFNVVTSSSHEQLKHQTENHIKSAIRSLNSKLGFEYYDSVEFHHKHPITDSDSRGGEIKLFATDEAGRAEGWHPLTPTGRLAIIINEAKTIGKPILDALDRCRGYSNWYEISSPGIRSGTFYQNYKRSAKFADGAIAEPFKYFSRKVSAFDCPHISEAEIKLVLDKHGYNSFIYQTSILANFAESATDVIIPFSLLEACETVPASGEEIGIGIDCAAGGDETVVWVRRGNKPIGFSAFIEPNVTAAARRIDEYLVGYKRKPYILNADDGGVGRGLLDALENLGWTVNRFHNQSAAYNTVLYSNVGAEMYGHTRDLFEAQNIIPPADEKTVLQLCTRKDTNTAGGGKRKLQSKRVVRSEGGESPDRSDAFVLCFFSRPLVPLGTVYPVEPSTLISQEELIRLAVHEPVKFSRMFLERRAPQRGRPTQLTDY